MDMFKGSSKRRPLAVWSGSKENVYPYLMDCFLRSRKESGNPSNVDYYEEDVNVYIVDLLCLLLDPVYYLQVEKYVTDFDSGVFEKVRESSDNRLRYWVYKANADHLLVSLGLFGAHDDGTGVGSPLSGPSARRAAARGMAYYGFARSYCEQLASPSRGVAEVLGKLSVGFEKYVAILDHMRGEYLNILDRISEGEMFHLQRQIERVRKEEHVRRKYDELLDLYIEWKKTGDRELLSSMREVSRELEALDPSFSFEIPQPVLS